jgi:hypothetical protein
LLLLISVFWVSRITEVSHQHLAPILDVKINRASNLRKKIHGGFNWTFYTLKSCNGALSVNVACERKTLYRQAKISISEG